LKVIKTVADYRDFRKKLDKEKTLGFVPTMGALHRGHESLIKKSVEQNDFTVVSVFVNPTQFGPNEDYDKYPRTLESDVKLAQSAGAEVVFAPSPDEMYSDLKDTTLICPSYFDVNKLCGKARPGHFDGVATVVGKLFNIIEPTRAYFGQKDAQQLFIIKKMVRDLNFDIEIVKCPIVRETTGIALSSRNAYLDDSALKDASKLSKALFTIKENKDKGVLKVNALIDIALSVLDGLDVEYFEILDLYNFDKIDIINKEAIALCAVRFSTKNGDTVRLIDNLEL
jgi:pantoate--beta-alanine ligase